MSDAILHTSPHPEPAQAESPRVGGCANREQSHAFYVSGHGIDTVAFVYRGADATRMGSILERTVVDRLTGEVLDVEHLPYGARRLRNPTSGLELSLRRLGGDRWRLWCEGRLSALSTGTVSDRRLAPKAELARGEEEVRSFGRAIGLPSHALDTAEVARADIAVDVRFPQLAQGRATLRALEAITSPRLSGAVYQGRGSASSTGRSWSNGAGIQFRAYDKATERLDRGKGVVPVRPGEVLRLERQYRPRGHARGSVMVFQALDLSGVWAGPFREWLRRGEAVVVGPVDLCQKLREMVGEAEVGRKKDGSPLLLSHAKAERIAGASLFLHCLGEDRFPSPRTARERKAEIRRLGLALDLQAQIDSDISVGDVFRAGQAALKADELAEGAANTRPSTSEEVRGIEA